MKALNKALPGLCIGIGLIVMGCLLSHGIITVKDRDRIVTVKGLAEREVKADRVIWPLVFKEIGNDMTSIYNAVNKKNEIVCDFLKNNGINENEISIAAPQIIDMRAERYANNNEIPYRYNVTSVITVTSNQIDKVRELISRQVDLLKQGVAIIDGDYRYTTQYSPKIPTANWERYGGPIKANSSSAIGTKTRPISKKYVSLRLLTII